MKWDLTDTAVLPLGHRRNIPIRQDRIICKVSKFSQLTFFYYSFQLVVHRHSVSMIQYLNIYSPQVWPEFSRTLYSRSPLSNPSTSPSTADAGLRGEVTKRRRRLRPQSPSSPAPRSVSRRNWSAVLPPGALRGSREREGEMKRRYL